MIHTLAGAAGFRQGMDLYFRRHDGQAVTCEDFVAAMADANHIDPPSSNAGYSCGRHAGAGCRLDWFAEGGAASLTVRQHCPTPQGKPTSRRFTSAGGGPAGRRRQRAAGYPGQRRRPGPLTRVLSVTEAEQTFTFVGLERKNRCPAAAQLSALVRLNYAYRDGTGRTLCAHDSDAFNRWEAGQDPGHPRAVAPVPRRRRSHAVGLPDRRLCPTADHADSDLAFAALALTPAG